ncbi:hypothetical protein DH86_00003797 [Scytalidium sp. 3C]|nr:hypothetical protein DH86_00003797 [Scytalidium sp. 3C]
MYANSIVAVALLAGLSAAQVGSNSTIDPNSVDLGTRVAWCNGEINTCGALCGGDVNLNTCSTDTLAYNCTCASNNSAPGLQYYQQTMPTFICEKIFQNCIVAGENDAAAQQLCKQNEANNCGHLSPPNGTTPSSTSAAPSSAPASSASAAATATGSASGTSSTPAPTTSKSGASAVVGGTSIFAIMVAAFGLLL